MRGIDFVQVPTTLLSQVDSSVGGKTGVNHPLGKNMIGAFHQPRLVLASVDTLDTLPMEIRFRHGRSGEIRGDTGRGIFQVAGGERGRSKEMQPDVLVHLIKRSCEIKAEVVGKDEREGGLRAILNFGHTVGHAASR